MPSFKVEQIDHVELFVPDRYAAARWYEETLGLRILPDYEHWAGPGGPLMISSDGGDTKLALFEGEARGQRRTAGHHRVAFRIKWSGISSVPETCSENYGVRRVRRGGQSVESRGSREGVFGLLLRSLWESFRGHELRVRAHQRGTGLNVISRVSPAATWAARRRFLEPVGRFTRPRMVTPLGFCEATSLCIKETLAEPQDQALPCRP